MVRSVAIIISGICALFGFYMAFLALRVGDDGAYLFAGFGLLFGIPFVILLIKAFQKRSASLERMDEKIPAGPQSVTFVPHWFMMAALIITGVCILAAILISIL